MRILIASPVRKEPGILQECLAGLERLETADFEVDHLFVDDNDCPESSDLLHGFGSAIIWPGGRDEDYHCDEDTHHWNDILVRKVAGFKDKIIAYARDNGYDYLFLVDSDLVLHPKTLTHLVSLDKDIVSEVFWTVWTPGSPPMPNVWQYESYGGVHPDFLDMLRKPGIYEVGGLGACTLLSRRALETGVSFAPIENLSRWGEDRWFCVRAQVLGLELWADTHYPPYHIYRESELPGLVVWKGRQRERGSKITVGMLVRNEAGRYLDRILWQVARCANRVVILDDASTDGSPQLCQDVFNSSLGYNKFSGKTSKNGGYSIEDSLIVSNEERGFNNEVDLRKQLWELAIKNNPDWIIILDADELLEPRALEEVRRMAADPEAEAWSFRLYDMWDADHYRDDALWNAHRRPWPMMVRHIPGR